MSNDKRATILEASTKLFAHYGYDKTSLDDIARDSRIAKATIYYYFPSKEDLFLEAIRNKAEEFFAMILTAVNATDDFVEKLSCFLRLPMKFIFDHMPILLEALRKLPTSYQYKLEDNRVEYRSRINLILTGILEYGMVKGIIDQNIDAERISEMINDWFLMGDTSFDLSDKDRILKRIDRDHELIINVILFGIIKR